MDTTLPLNPMDLEDDLPMLTLVTAGLLMTLPLLVPAVVAAAWRGCLDAWTSFGAIRVAQCWRDQPPGEPSARFGSDDGFDSWNHDESVTRGLSG